MTKLTDNKDILISVIVINFNNKAGLEKTLESIKEQDVSCYEVIFIDGGSTDGSLDVANGYSFLFSTTLIGQDTGIYNAMNLGIERACGRYLLFLNSGDYLFDVNVFNTVYANVSAGADDTLLFGYAEIISDMTSWLFPLVKISNDSSSLRQWLNHHEPTHQAMFFPKKYCLNYPFDEQLLIIADKKFKRGALEQLDYSFIPLPLVKFSLGGVSSHINDLNQLKTFFRDYQKYYISEKITLSNLLSLIKADLKVTIKYMLQKTLHKDFWRFLGVFKSKI